MAKSDMLGAWGEQRAAEYLRKQKYKIVACNYRSRLGEIDIIASKKDMIVFVEVKLRKSAEFAQAKEFVGLQKQRRILATAELWLSESDCCLQPRFDVVEVYAPEGMQTKIPQIIHYENAFQ